ncbi:MAG: aldo/keto reductase [Haliscomenobacteraceae bacterium CHB4]|nr:putative oxidoreductase YtbE [Saprospiraceae bacterium]MCE7923331.1 aldo/keto reductase [Haliscomenobacteraceae bacterium CHB4]
MKNTLSRRDLLKLAGYTGVAATLPFMFQNKTMLKRRILSSGNEMLPVVGLGTWIQFDVGKSEEERKPLGEVLKRMAEHGGKVIDSSPMYGNSEEVVGDRATAMGLADKFFYATKVWTTGEQEGIRQMQASLRKMRRTTMDLMQIHNLMDWQTHLKTLRKWKDEGKVRYIGITHYTVTAHEQLEKIIRSEKIDFVQFNYSIRVRNAETSLLKTAQEKGVSVIINEPFEKGSLFSAVKGKELPEWAADYDIKSWAQFFLKFILSHPAVTCVIPGTSNPEHLADNMGAGFGKLPDEAGRKKMAEFIGKL